MKTLLLCLMIAGNVHAAKLVSMVRYDRGNLTANPTSCGTHSTADATRLVLGIQQLGKKEGMNCRVVDTLPGVKTLLCAKRSSMLTVTIAGVDNMAGCQQALKAMHIASAQYTSK